MRNAPSHHSGFAPHSPKTGAWFALESFSPLSTALPSSSLASSTMKLKEPLQPLGAILSTAQVVALRSRHQEPLEELTPVVLLALLAASPNDNLNSIPQESEQEKMLQTNPTVEKS